MGNKPATTAAEKMAMTAAEKKRKNGDLRTDPLFAGFGCRQGSDYPKTPGYLPAYRDGDERLPEKILVIPSRHFSERGYREIDSPLSFLNIVIQTDGTPHNALEQLPLIGNFPYIFPLHRDIWARSGIQVKDSPATPLPPEECTGFWISG